VHRYGYNFANTSSLFEVISDGIRRKLVVPWYSLIPLTDATVSITLCCHFNMLRESFSMLLL